MNGTGWCPARSKRPEVIPPGEYYVLGDNRDNSEDSRYWGRVKRELIRGRVSVVYWSWDAESGSVRWERIGRKDFGKPVLETEHAAPSSRGGV